MPRSVTAVTGAVIDGGSSFDVSSQCLYEVSAIDVVCYLLPLLLSARYMLLLCLYIFSSLL